jgi:hypothetical protein
MARRWVQISTLACLRTKLSGVATVGETQKLKKRHRANRENQPRQLWEARDRLSFLRIQFGELEQPR